MNIVRDFIKPLMKEKGQLTVGTYILLAIPFVHQRVSIEFTEDAEGSTTKEKFINILSSYKEQGKEPLEVADIFKKQISKSKFLCDDLSKAIYRYWKEA